jgi:hypothetical protein
MNKYRPSIWEWVLCIGRDAFIKTFLPKLILLPLGFLFVAIGVFTMRPGKPTAWDEKQGPQYPGWKRLHMHPFFWIWDNDEVGGMGDHTWPANNPKWLDINSKFGMYVWYTFRNPVNNLQQLIGQNLDLTAKITWAGQVVVDSSEEIATPGWHFVKCECDGKITYSFYLVHQYASFPSKCLRIRMGYKVKPDVDIVKKMELDDIVGTVCLINQFKTFADGKQKRK